MEKVTLESNANKTSTQVKKVAKEDDSKTKVKVVKNKVAPPFREALFQIMYGQGTNRLGELVDLAAAQDIVQKSGAWYAYQGSKIGQGKNNVVRYFEDNPQVAEDIEQQVRGRLLAKPSDAAAYEQENADTAEPTADELEA